MSTSMIFPNLSVKDLEKTMNFFKQLGFSFNEKFTNDQAACLVMNEMAAVMLLKEPFFKSFTTKKLTDATQNTEMILAVSFESKAKVDELLTKALSLGATEGRKEDLGFMYSRAFNDLDGHIWEFFWMDQNA